MCPATGIRSNSRIFTRPRSPDRTEGGGPWINSSRSRPKVRGAGRVDRVGPRARCNRAAGSIWALTQRTCSAISGRDRGRLVKHSYIRPSNRPSPPSATISYGRRAAVGAVPSEGIQGLWVRLPAQCPGRDLSTDRPQCPVGGQSRNRTPPRTSIRVYSVRAPDGSAIAAGRLPEAPSQSNSAAPILSAASRCVDGVTWL